jgi:hypothetical protein
MRFVLDEDPAINFLKWSMLGMVVVSFALAIGVWFV